MRPTAEEVLEFFSQRTHLIPAQFDAEVCRKHRKCLDAVFRIEQTYQLYLVCGRIQWRCQLGDPRPNLQEAIKVAQIASRYSQNLTERQIGNSHFQFGSAALLDYIVNSRFAKRFTKLLPSVANWTQYRSSAPRNAPDAGLVHFMVKKTLPDGWEAMLKGVSVAPKDKDLYTRSYRSYAAILGFHFEKRTKDLISEIQQCATLFEERAHDDAGKYYSSFHGGSGITDKIVDHRLAAVIKYCCKDNPKLAERIDTYHQWPFD